MPKPTRAAKIQVMVYFRPELNHAIDVYAASNGLYKYEAFEHLLIIGLATEGVAVPELPAQ